MAASWRLARRYGVPVDLPVRADLDELTEPVGGSVTTLGAARISQRRSWLRTWALPFGPLTDAEVAGWRVWMNGTYGPGPFELYTPENALIPVLVNVAGFAPHRYQRGLQSLVVTLEEVGL